MRSFLLTLTVMAGILAQAWGQDTVRINNTTKAVISPVPFRVGQSAVDPTAPGNGSLWYDTATNTLEARINGATVSLGASNPPGGATTQVQFNDAGAFGGDSLLTYNKTTDFLTIFGLTATGNAVLNGAAIFEGNIDMTPQGGVITIAPHTGGSGTINNVVIGDATPLAGTFTALNATSTGATTPGTGAFTTLSASGQVTASGDLYVGSGNVLEMNALGIGVKSTGYIAFASTTNAGATKDVTLFRDAANTFAQRNGTAAQALRVYNTYATGGVDFERGVMDWTTSANVLRIGYQAGGTGSAARDVVLNTSTSGNLFFAHNLTSRWKMDTSGHWLAVTDNTFDIGASGATRPRNGYFGTSVVTPLLNATGPVRLKGYTVAALPAGTQGDTAFVTDATAPTYLGALTGGGAVVCPVFYNGAAWVSH